MLNVTRYSIKNEQLKNWVKFIWLLEAEDINIYYKLLPTDCIDIVLNLSGSIEYEVDSLSNHAPLFHINGLRRRHSYIRQTGDIRVLGISFYPFGLYPFVNKSLACINDKVVDLFEISPSLAQNLKLSILDGATVESIVDNIEKALCLELRATESYMSKAKLILDFLELDSDFTIQSFCAERGVNVKTFKRNVEYYTGYTPKILHSIKRFQKTGNQLIYQKPNQLLNVAYDNGFADQAHFTREFHKFSGTSPRIFQQEKITVKENTEYTHR